MYILCNRKKSTGRKGDNVAHFVSLPHNNEMAPRMVCKMLHGAASGSRILFYRVHCRHGRHQRRCPVHIRNIDVYCLASQIGKIIYSKSKVLMEMDYNISSSLKISSKLWHSLYRNDMFRKYGDGG